MPVDPQRRRFLAGADQLADINPDWVSGVYFHDNPDGLLQESLALPDPDVEESIVADLLAVLGGKTFVFTSGTGVLIQRTAGVWSEDSFAENDPSPSSRSPRAGMAWRTWCARRAIVVRTGLGPG